MSGHSECGVVLIVFYGQIDRVILLGGRIASIPSGRACVKSNVFL